MALTAEKFIVTNGSPSGGKQPMQSSVVGPDNVLSNVTVIRSESDFPNVVGSLSTWPSGVYLIDGQVSHSVTIRRAAGAQVWIKGNSLTNDALIYTGSGYQFDCDPTEAGDLNSLFNVTRLGLFQSGGAVAMFNFNNTNRQGTFWLEKVYCLGSATNTSTLGTVKNYGFFTLIESFIAVQWDAGFTIDDIGQVSLNCQFSEWKNSSGTFLTLGSGTYGRFNMSGAASFAAPGSTEHVLDIDSAATFTTIATITGVSYTPDVGGGFFKAGGLDQTDPQINVINCGIPDSAISAEVDAGTPTVSTNIPATGANVLVNSDTWASYEKERITVDSSGVSEYVGLRDARLEVHFSGSVDPSSGTNKLLELQIGRICCDPKTVTFDNTTNVVNEFGTALSNGDLVSFYDTPGTLPAALRKDILYYVVNKTTNTFQLSYTSGGSAISFADDGTPTNQYNTAALEPIKSSGNIDAGSPSSLTRFGIASVAPGEKVCLIARNATDSINIDMNSGGYIIRGF